MKGRVLWFVAGTTAGVYGSVKARRLAYRLTPAGVTDQIAAWQLGAQAFADELRTGMAHREAEIAAQLGLPALSPAADDRRSLGAAPPAAPHAPLPLSPYDE
ncbi:hypothetical protein KV102_18445 [Mumia sp. zg.B53]|uniref:DUF6167 family protein n=1 Tax=unclassified Mumia TaxID=2621872 RepID=UPI001C6E8D46|nr:MULTISPECIES: DUF6167 family protein [unclassified Mumia]MBW9216823.1 hypothetical protein [Mumia sp. zg.B53]MDD9348413.1 DUF6167 family protein [Mumia sp.]